MMMIKRNGTCKAIHLAKTRARAWANLEKNLVYNVFSDKVTT
jgi:hypothetical protein